MTNTPNPASRVRANRLFIFEDLDKMENLVNLTLFGAHSIPEFWEPLCDLLRIPKGDKWRGGIGGTEDDCVARSAAYRLAAKAALKHAQTRTCRSRTWLVR